MNYKSCFYNVRQNTRLTIIDTLDFRAEVVKNDSQISVCVSRGLIDKCQALSEFHYLKFHAESGIPQGLENSCFGLRWVFEHELSHIELGHFRFADSFAVAKRIELKSDRVSALSTDLRPFARACMELQADNEASELLLGAYSSEDWLDLRSKISAIFAVMVLIEREEVKLDFGEKTHPKAATRIFQLLCHVAEMPLISAHLQQDASFLPPSNEIERFGKEVTLPCYFDAVHLAEVAGAESIQADLGRPEDFFADMAIAKLDDHTRYSDLKTEGAKEWAQLWKCNEALKPLQKGVHFAN